MSPTPETGFRTAFVATTSPLTVRFPGTATAVPALRNSAYAPTSGDRVAVVPLDGSKLLVEGKIA